jgi:hypothetical protein
MRLYRRHAEHVAAQAECERLCRRWKVHRAPQSVACRQLGIDEDTLARWAAAAGFSTISRKYIGWDFCVAQATS